MKYLKYLRYLLRHRFWVLWYCIGAGIVWRGLTHDLSKFRPSEFIPYARHQFNRTKTGYYKPTDTGDAAFDFAWLLHQKRNRHHWQWWILPEDEGGVKVLKMPYRDIEEMLCDWKGAARAQGVKNHRDVGPWYETNKRKMQLNAGTRLVVEALI